MRAEDFVKGQVALLCYQAAPHKILNNYSAIALMLRNRVQAGWEGGDWLRLVETYPTTAYKPLTPGYPVQNDQDWRRFLVDLNTIYEGSAPDKLTSGGLYCAVLHDSPSDWFLNNICRQPEAHPRVAQVQELVFFK